MPKCEFNVRWEAAITKSVLKTIEDHRREWGERELTVNERKILWAYGTPRNYIELMKVVSLVHKLVLRQEEVFSITKDIINRYHADNVVYLEMRVIPCLSSQLTLELFVKKMIDAILERQENHIEMMIKITLTVNVCEPLQKLNEFPDNADSLHEVLVSSPDRLCNAEVLNINERGGDSFYQRIFRDHLISKRIPTGFGEAMGRDLSTEYYYLALEMNLSTSQIYKLARKASFFIKRTEKYRGGDYLLYTKNYDEFANSYKLDASVQWQYDYFLVTHTFLSRPLPRKRNRRCQRRINDVLYL
ncbi:unnamed protein product [Thelazia callipaeda]|uniref:CULLIN_2 domain-containing protein n=1 Tax=Thelazia callipaeda TaxID=103827 RepID=A0A0N5CRS7_THECL|nr:unnamed protein product [Thelazia callipaeda]